jgi:hypothetical protein
VSKKKKDNRMMFYKHNQKYGSFAKWQELCNNDCFHIAKPNDLSGLLPEKLLHKSNAVLIMERETSGSSVFVADLNRIDVNSSGSQIDQHPYIVAFDRNGSTSLGGFIDHGTWVNRTMTYIDPKLWLIVSGSDILSYLPIAEMPSAESGKITELKIPSQNAAFATAFKLLINQGRKK